jgi:hypothetical protein
MVDGRPDSLELSLDLVWAWGGVSGGYVQGDRQAWVTPSLKVPLSVGSSKLGSMLAYIGWEWSESTAGMGDMQGAGLVRA